tara:strand:+ start:1360 stop:1911 length:552 start_codon:yes stop_codon:yes gene_type:complete
MTDRFIFESTKISGVFVVKLNPLIDSRGSLTRLFCSSEFSQIKDFSVRQINIVSNLKQGTVRGLHFQRWPGTEGKIIFCLTGEVFDFCIDVRKNSKTYGIYEELYLNSEVGLFLPPGIAHGYQTQTDKVDMIYMHSADYVPEYDDGINWKNSFIEVEWPLKISNMSKKDTLLPRENFYEVPKL